MCEYEEVCHYFENHLANRPKLIKFYKRHYCETYPLICARYIITREMGIETVPGDLSPNTSYKHYDPSLEAIS